MKKYYVSYDPIKSEKWRQFLVSAAAALQVNLVLFCVGSEAQFSAGNSCPECGLELEYWNAAYQTAEDTTNVRDARTQGVALIRLDAHYAVAVRHYPCCQKHSTMELDECARIAQGLLCAFYNGYNDQANEELRAELTALHQADHVILSAYRGGQHTFERVTDLILSAAILLCDAEGCWLEYDAKAQQCIITKGSCRITSEDTLLHKNITMTAEIYSPVIQASFGMVPPVESARAKSFLCFIVNECISLMESDMLLESMESKLTMILDAVDNMVLLVDRSKNIRYANKAASELLSRPIHELITRSVFDIDAPWRQRFSAAAGTVIKGVKDVLTCGSGNKQIDWEIYPLERGSVIAGWFVLARARADFYHFSELGMKIDNLVQTSTMINVIAHEVRNPLATIKGLLQIINLKNNEPEINKYTDIGMKEIEKLALLLDDFSQLGRATAISLEETDMKAFMEDFMILVKAGFSGSATEIVSSICPVKPVLADKRMLTHAVYNLVKNAYEALSSRGTMTLCLKDYDKDWVELSIHDNGPGISEDIKDKLFKPYFTTKAEGTGLGLSITKSIVRSHYGKISAYNPPGGGACFSILLPAVLTVDYKRAATDVVIAMNDDLTRIASEGLFKAENIAFYSIGKGESLRSTIEKYRPHIIFADGNYLSVHILKKTLTSIAKDYPDIKILIAGDKILEESAHVFYIPKPLDYTKLAETVRSI